ncbi:hypothetical protein C8R43DRAFT_877667, partial [Mycena crocata]
TTPPRILSSSMGKPIFGLIIGINQYRSDEITSLKGCVWDAPSMQDVLLEHSKDAEIVSLIDAAATRAAILTAFRDNLINNPRIMRDDPIVVYFACKGRRLNFPDDFSRKVLDVLLPHDHSSETPGISGSAVHALLCDLSQKKGENIVSVFLRFLFANFKFDISGTDTHSRHIFLCFGTA